MGASGAFESINLNGRHFSCKNDDNPEVIYSGFSNETIVHADGSFHQKKTRHPGSISGVNIIIDDARDDMEFLQETSDSLESFAFTATKVDGTVLSGSGQFVEDIKTNAGENTVAIKIEGKVEKL